MQKIDLGNSHNDPPSQWKFKTLVNTRDISPKKTMNLPVDKVYQLQCL
jgi:hypothetical protein